MGYVVKLFVLNVSDLISFRAILDASWLDKLEEFTVSGKVVKHLEDSIAIAFQKIVVFTRQVSLSYF